MSRSRRRTEIVSFYYSNGVIIMRWREIWTYSVWHEVWRLCETVIGHASVRL